MRDAYDSREKNVRLFQALDKSRPNLEFTLAERMMGIRPVLNHTFCAVGRSSVHVRLVWYNLRAIYVNIKHADASGDDLSIIHRLRESCAFNSQANTYPNRMRRSYFVDGRRKKSCRGIYLPQTALSQWQRVRQPL